MNYSGEQLRFLRSFKKIKQSVVANRLGITQQMISKTEQRRRIDEQLFEQYLRALQLEKQEAVHLLYLMHPPENG
jgi:transcriptional regulator with XRE-family HTH domain